jgi:hypothetical protein
MTEPVDSEENRKTAAHHFILSAPVIEQVIVDAIAGLGEHIPPDLRRRIGDGFRQRSEVIERVMVEGIITHFTVAEIDAMTRFQASAEGRSSAAKMRSYNMYIGQQLLPMLLALVEEVQRGT